MKDNKIPEYGWEASNSYNKMMSHLKNHIEYQLHKMAFDSLNCPKFGCSFPPGTQKNTLME